jgi:hypothetical protein
MGNFYTNYTLKGPRQDDVAAALRGRKALVAPAQNGCVVAFDEQSDEQNQEIIVGLASELSRRFACPVLAVLNHDDDILWYQLYLRGEMTDEYNSAPSYFDQTATEKAPPAGGDAKKLCAAFQAGQIEEVERILRKSAFEEDGYVFAFERHADLVRALGISPFAVGTAYASFDRQEYPEGLSSEDLVSTS